MNGLILTDTHLLFGDWTNLKDKFILNDLKYIPLSKRIKEILQSQNEMRTVLTEALNGLPVQGNRVAIAIDDDLIYHDKFTSDESLSKREIWEYLQWETKQKWGELGKYYTSFAEIDSPNPNALHSISCPSFLITEIKAILANKKADPIWAGAVSTIYLENTQFRNAVYMSDDDSFLKYFYRGRDGYSDGKLRFIGGQPSVTVGIGDNEEQSNLFKSPSDARDFVTIDLISDTKNSYLRQYRHKPMLPFEGIDVKTEDIPEDVTFKLLNALSIMIKDFAFDNSVNFFKPTEIQKHSDEGLGKIDFDESGNRVDRVETDSKQDHPIKEKRRRRASKKTVEKPKRNFLLPILLIALIGLLGYYFFFNNNGKDLLSDLKSKFGSSKSVDRSTSLLYFDNQFNQSASILDTYNTLSTVIVPDSVISFKLIDSNGTFEFVGVDSIDIPDFSPINYSIEPIDCCGGIKQSIDFDIKSQPFMRSNIWISTVDIVNQLKSVLNSTGLRQLELIDVNGTSYTPVIFKMESISNIDKTIQYLKYIGDNVIVRKIDISNTPPENNHVGTFYIAIFEPL